MALLAVWARDLHALHLRRDAAASFWVLTYHRLSSEFPRPYPLPNSPSVHVVATKGQLSASSSSLVNVSRAPEIVTTPPSTPSLSDITHVSASPRLASAKLRAVLRRHDLVAAPNCLDECESDSLPPHSLLSRVSVSPAQMFEEQHVEGEGDMEEEDAERGECEPLTPATFDKFDGMANGEGDTVLLPSACYF